MKPTKEMEREFEKRMKDKAAQEAKEGAEESDKLRRDYLRRTGRTKMEP